MDEKNVEIPPDLMENINFENLIWQCTPESLEKARKMEPFKNRIYLRSIIYKVKDLKCFSYKLLGDLFYKEDVHGVLFNNSVFSNYLFVRGLISKEDIDVGVQPENTLHDIEYYENPIKQGTIGNIIMQDDLQGFIDFGLDHCIDLIPQSTVVTGTQQTANASQQNPIRITPQTQDFLSLFTNRISLFDCPYTYVEFACLCGSFKIFKYLYLNECPVSDWALDKAISSGSEEIVEFLASKGHSFDYRLDKAVMYHQNKIAKWMYENYQDCRLKLSDCIRYCNTEMFFYFMKYGETIYPNVMLSIGFACYNNDFPLVTYFLNRESKENFKESYLQCALHMARTKEMKLFLQFKD